MKKILFVIPSLGNGGAEHSLVNLLNELPPDLYDIELLLFKKTGMFLTKVPCNIHILEQPPILKKLYAPALEAGIYLPIKVIGVGLSKVFASGMGAQKAFLWKYFYGPIIDGLDKEYDIAIGYLGGESTYYIVDCVKAKRKIHWVHNDYRKSGMPKKNDLELFYKVDAIVTISDECLVILKEEFPQFADKCYCIANITASAGVKRQADEFFPEEYINVENILLSIGRLSEQKGFDLAIAAARILKSQDLNFKWFIIGSGNLREKLNAQINEANVSDCVVLIGTRENPYPYIKNCDIFVQPSRFEGKSMVLDEAKILAKPIVATSYLTVKDQIKSGKEGIITEMDPQGIAEGVKLMMKNMDLRNQIHEYLAEHEYGNQEEMQKYIDIFEGV